MSSASRLAHRVGRAEAMADRLPAQAKWAVVVVGPDDPVPQGDAVVARVSYDPAPYVGPDGRLDLTALTDAQFDELRTARAARGVVAAKRS